MRQALILPLMPMRKSIIHLTWKKGIAQPIIGGMLSNNSTTEIHYGEYLWFWLYGDPNGPGNSDTIKQVSLVRLPSVTHSFNQNQWFKTYLDASDPRYSTYVDPGDPNEPPTIQRHWTNANDLFVKIPSRREAMPPGHYMLFALNAAGVPSVAKIIRVSELNNQNDNW